MESVDAEERQNEMKGGIDLNKLMGGTTFCIEGSREDYTSEMFDVTNSYDDTPVENPYTAQTFSELAKTMVKVSDLISKKIVVEGNAEIPKFAEVQIHYNAYFEGANLSFDSTYIRGTPVSFVLGNGPALPGIHLAVETMKIGEESQFIISYKLLYGDFGSPPRIPEKADALFIIKLIDAKDVNAKLHNPQTEFFNKYNQAMVFDSLGKQDFKRHKFEFAINNYKRAISEVKDVFPDELDEKEARETFLHRVYLNLAICYNKVEKWQNTCNTIEKMNAIRSIQNHSKALYTQGCAFLGLNRYKEARTVLQLADQLNPRNDEIFRAFQRLDVNERKYLEEERNMCINAMGIMSIADETKQEPEEDPVLTKVRQILEEFKLSAADSITLPSMLTATEMMYIKKLGPEFNTGIQEVPTEKTIEYKLVKKINTNGTYDANFNFIF